MSDPVSRYLRKQATRIVSLGADVAQDEPDAVHQMRVASRRLRSTLATFRPVLHRDVTDPLRDELKWLGSMLGPPRDAEVLRERFSDSGLTEVDRLLAERHQLTHAQLVAALQGRRYAALRVSLEALADRPPARKRARRKPATTLPPLVAKACRRVDRAAKVAVREGGGDLLLHEVRKAAKRARYAGEALAPEFGDPAGSLAAAMEHLQEVLGEHRDGLVAQDFLAGHALEASDPAYERVLEQQRRRTAEAEGDWPAALSAAQDKALRAWTEVR